MGLRSIPLCKRKKKDLSLIMVTLLTGNCDLISSVKSPILLGQAFPTLNYLSQTLAFSSKLALTNVDLFHAQLKLNTW